VKTYYLGRDEVDAFARDLAQRLIALGEDAPRVIFFLGNSGEKFVDCLLAFLSEAPFFEEIEVFRVDYNRGTEDIAIAGDAEVPELKTRACLVIDSAVHSGLSMTKAVQEVWRRDAEQVLTYALVLKRSSSFIPNYFGLMMGETDRALFLLDRLPTNRLIERKPFGVLCEIRGGEPYLSKSGFEAPFDGYCVGDLLYNRDAYGMRPFVYLVANEPAAFLAAGKRGHAMFIDAIATFPDFQKRGIAGALLRWSETLARSMDCRTLQLWAYGNEDLVRLYGKFGFEMISDSALETGNARYSLMEKKLLRDPFMDYMENFE
jgi:GNAT superfamily N-acetyltransferase/hypoxanthine-guanine phosphoribosyltransferase